MNVFNSNNIVLGKRNANFLDEIFCYKHDYRGIYCFFQSSILILILWFVLFVYVLHFLTKTRDKR